METKRYFKEFSYMGIYPKTPRYTIFENRNFLFIKYKSAVIYGLDYQEVTQILKELNNEAIA